jgi:nucleoside-triphosphatase THEP1
LRVLAMSKQSEPLRRVSETAGPDSLNHALSTRRALAAMEAPERGAFRLIPPDGFMPLLESMTGLAPLCVLKRPLRRVRVSKDRDPRLLRSEVASGIERCVGMESPWPLFLTGPAGCGKSCAALCLADRVDGNVLMNDFDQLCETLRKAKFGELVSYGTHAETIIQPADFWRTWRKAELCIVDEIGTRERASDHAYETLKHAIDKRDGLPLVLISNLALPQIERIFDDRIASRIGGGTVLQFAGEDRRLRRAVDAPSTVGVS